MIRMKHIATVAAFAALSLTVYADKATDFIRDIEGFRSSVYLCQAGEQAIGYGFTAPDLIAKGTISEAEANKELTRICGEIRNRLRRDLKGQRLTENEETAIISFIYNVGWYNFKASTMFRLILHGKRGTVVAKEFRRWVYITKHGKKIKSNGIKNRRMKEFSMFLKR